MNTRLVLIISQLLIFIVQNQIINEKKMRTDTQKKRPLFSFVTEKRVFNLVLSDLIFKFCQIALPHFRLRAWKYILIKIRRLYPITVFRNIDRFLY